MQLVVGAVLTLAALGCWGVVRAFSPAGLGSPFIIAVVGAAIFVGWRSPIRIYRDSGSWGFQLDAGYFVLLSLVVQPAGVLLAFGAATAASQLSNRRTPIKALYNVGHNLLSCSAGLAVLHGLSPPGTTLSIASIGAGALGAMCYEAVNVVGTTVLMRALGTAHLSVAATILRQQWLLIWTAIALGASGALAVSREPWAVVLILLPFFALRSTLAASFHALFDHARVRLLLNATLDVQKTVGEEAILLALGDQAKALLRCTDAKVIESRVAPALSLSQLAAPIEFGGAPRWLVVSGRDSRIDPFDDADQGLLEALAAVGSTQLENAALYEERQREQERVVTITANLGEGVCAFDSSGAVTFVNPAARDLLRLGADVHAGSVSPATLVDLIEPAMRVVASGTAIEDERASFLRTDGTTLPVEYSCTPIHTAEGVSGAVVTFRDVSERLAFEEQLEFHAFRDSLTGLPNRRVFLDRLEHALRRARRSGELLAVFFVDVDRFKVVNDSLGHQAGDQLLVAIAERLQSLTRPEDTLARFGGDEFTLLLEGVPSTAAAESVANRMLDVVHGPVVVEGERSVIATISVGIALASGSSSPDDVLHNADVAMYQAKRRRAGQYAVFDAEAMTTRSAERIDLEAALRRAVLNRELTVHYQPLYAARGREIVGAEALVRWPHPERGLLPPGDFIPMAEETGLVLELGEFVLEESCEMARRWQDLGTEEFTVSVNLSAQQFQEPALVEKVAKAVAEVGLAPKHLCIEITENLALQDIDRSIATLSELKALGVKLAIDDFGTGYSSLTYLKRLPVDVVKLDKTFVQDLAVSAVDAAIVLAVVELARTLGLTAVAEGVETVDQMERLAEMGCPVLQGYLLARPMPSEEFSEMLVA